MNRMKKLSILMVLTFVACMLVACGPSNRSVTINNNTDQDMVSVVIIENGATSDGANLLEDADDSGTVTPIATGEGNELIYIQEASDEDEGKTYDITVTFDDDSEKVFESVDLTDADAVDIVAEDGVIYISYESKESGETVSTRDAELEAKKKAEEEAARKKAEEEAKKKAEEEEAARKKAEEEAAAAAAAAAEAEAARQQKQQQQQQQSQSSGSNDECLDDPVTY